MLDPQTEENLNTLTDQIAAAFGDDLKSLALFGSGAGGDFTPGISRLDLAIVVGTIRFEHLERLRTNLPSWQKLGASVPLLLDDAFLAHAGDVFPMEFLDMKSRHRILRGTNPFAGLVVDGTHLRFQLEQEARAKLLRLRLAYATSGSQHEAVLALRRQSAKSFVAILRSILQHLGLEVPATKRGVVEEFERRTRVRLPALTAEITAALGQAGSDSEVMRRYLSDAERIVAFVDHPELPSK